ncbi:hypothetical protein ACFLZV_00255 [Candidatus Margulisiibacteriota bacterium]
MTKFQYVKRLFNGKVMNLKKIVSVNYIYKKTWDRNPVDKDGVQVFQRKIIGRKYKFPYDYKQFRRKKSGVDRKTLKKIEKFKKTLKLKRFEEWIGHETMIIGPEGDTMRIIVHKSLQDVPSEGGGRKKSKSCEKYISEVKVNGITYYYPFVINFFDSSLPGNKKDKRVTHIDSWTNFLLKLGDLKGKGGFGLVSKRNNTIKPGIKKLDLVTKFSREGIEVTKKGFGQVLDTLEESRKLWTFRGKMDSKVLKLENYAIGIVGGKIITYADSPEMNGDLKDILQVMWRIDKQKWEKEYLSKILKSKDGGGKDRKKRLWEIHGKMLKQIEKKDFYQEYRQKLDAEMAIQELDEFEISEPPDIDVFKLWKFTKEEFRKVMWYLTYELLTAVSVFQTSKMLHLDIKPGNVFFYILGKGFKSKLTKEIFLDLVKRKKLKLLLGDLGASVSAGTLKEEDKGQASPYFMPPERAFEFQQEASGSIIHKTGDLWSAAITLAYLVDPRNPFFTMHPYNKIFQLGQLYEPYAGANENTHQKQNTQKSSKKKYNIVDKLIAGLKSHPYADKAFCDFIQKVLEIDYKKRPEVNTLLPEVYINIVNKHSKDYSAVEKLEAELIVQGKITSKNELKELRKSKRKNKNQEYIEHLKKIIAQKIEEEDDDDTSDVSDSENENTSNK